MRGRTLWVAHENTLAPHGCPDCGLVKGGVYACNCITFGGQSVTKGENIFALKRTVSEGENPPVFRWPLHGIWDARAPHRSSWNTICLMGECGESAVKCVITAGSPAAEIGWRRNKD